MVKRIESKFIPTVAIPPGVTLKENIEYLGINQDEFAARIGITPKHLSQIITGVSPITYDTALKLEKIFGMKAEFWMNLESAYQLDKARIAEQHEIEEELKILKDIPYKEMINYGWISKETDKTRIVSNIRSFYKVASLRLVKNSYNVRFRQNTTKNKISDFGVIAWIRQAEIEGSKEDTSNFDKVSLEKLIPEFRKLTLEEPSVFYPKMKYLCSKCGVSLVLVESLPRTYINGATIWLNNKPILALSVRGKKADIFWFTFFHELAHILHHRKNQSSISIQDDEENEEIEANYLAGNYLIDEDKYKYFIQNMNYENIAIIAAYASRLNIATHILIGRLLHDKLIDFKYFNKYRPSFEIVTKE